MRLTPISKRSQTHGFKLVHGHLGSNYPAIALEFHCWFHFPAALGGGAVVFGFWSSAVGRSLWGYAGWVGLRRQGAEPPKSRGCGVTELIKELRSRARVTGVDSG